MGRLGLGLGLGLGLPLGLRLGIEIGFRRNHSWSSIYTPRRNEASAYHKCAQYICPAQTSANYVDMITTAAFVCVSCC